MRPGAGGGATHRPMCAEMVRTRRLEWMATAAKMLAPSVVTTSTIVAMSEARGPKMVTRGPPSAGIMLGTAMSAMKNTTATPGATGNRGVRARGSLSWHVAAISSRR